VSEVVRAASVHYSLPIRDFLDGSAATVRSDAEFSFDDVVVNSIVYRRILHGALQSAHASSAQMLTSSVNPPSAAEVTRASPSQSLSGYANPSLVAEATRASSSQAFDAFATEAAWPKPMFN
jgi:hypothetical protein